MKVLPTILDRVREDGNRSTSSITRGGAFLWSGKQLSDSHEGLGSMGRLTLIFKNKPKGPKLVSSRYPIRTASWLPTILTRVLSWFSLAFPLVQIMEMFEEDFTPLFRQQNFILKLRLQIIKQNYSS
jgi:hypothetical protein